MGIFSEIFCWWGGNTWGTRLTLWNQGRLVGKDEFGNRYFRQKNGNRRWVIYDGEAEASRISAAWHGWMHKRTDVAPPDDTYKPRDWEKPHLPNLTGTPAAYKPKGSILGTDTRPQVTGDYEPWKPV
jgi:NADH:ubiquinone oxidoreductase subunit